MGSLQPLTPDGCGLRALKTLERSSLKTLERSSLKQAGGPEILLSGGGARRIETAPREESSRSTISRDSGSPHFYVDDRSTKAFLNAVVLSQVLLQSGEYSR